VPSYPAGITVSNHALITVSDALRHRRAQAAEAGPVHTTLTHQAVRRGACRFAPAQGAADLDQTLGNNPCAQSSWSNTARFRYVAFLAGASPGTAPTPAHGS
jgi:hypothetical protein